jgi:hypothetical protein
LRENDKLLQEMQKLLLEAKALRTATEIMFVYDKVKGFPANMINNQETLDAAIVRIE